MNVATDPSGVLALATSTNRAHLSRLAKRGDAVRLAAGIYIVGGRLPVDALVRHHLFDIVNQVWSDAVISGRSALAGGLPVDGVLYLVHPSPPRFAPLRLPGVTVQVRIGPGPLPGDMRFPNGVALAGVTRGLVENVNLPGRPASGTAGTAAVEDIIDELARTGGAGKVRNALTQLDVIAGNFDPAAVALVRTRLSAALGSFSGQLGVTSTRLAARLSGQPFDQHRIDLLRGLTSSLEERAPVPRNASRDPRDRAWLPFFEAYFSNYIEGTEFDVAEARAIAIDGLIPANRPQDAHDVAATYRLAADATDSATVPKTGNELLDLLRSRHEVLMAARPEKRPGEFKERPNFAGGYRFVEPDLVTGTLIHGFALIDALIDPFARATAMMLLITECHPFDDGNGRVARLLSNAELTAAGQSRIVIPSVYRNNYIAGLNGASNGVGKGQTLIAVLDFVQRWTVKIRWVDFALASDDIKATNGFIDPAVAEAQGLRLTLPTEQ